MSKPDYVLGHSDREIERLKAQNLLIGPFTRQFFQLAGIGPGMHLLDVGSGAGDVSILAAEFVGPAGTVTGVDIAAAAVNLAQGRTAGLGLKQVSFRQGDPADMTFERPFDAIVGRYVLMFQADAGAMLRGLARHLRPGGVAVFHEPDWSFVRSTPSAPLYDLCCRRIVDVFDRVGTSTNMAAKLHRVFVAGGLPPPAMRMEALIGSPNGAAGWITAVAELTITLLPTMQRLGMVAADDPEMDPATLAERMHREVAALDSIVVGRAETGAWSRV
jgi:2-polyprenyl-3-methyl-5-hydroxy-6-metoxy-1,4-benzoquinol methylase